jgi:hypothetical protein
MVKRIGWTSILAGKLDDFFMGERQRSSREESRNGLANIVLGICLVVVSIWNLLARPGDYGFTGMLFLTALGSLAIGFGNLWVHKRRLLSDAYREAERLPGDLSIYKQDFSAEANNEKLSSASTTNEIDGKVAPAIAPPSITEHTTISLKGKR